MITPKITIAGSLQNKASDCHSSCKTGLSRGFSRFQAKIVNQSLYTVLRQTWRLSWSLLSYNFPQTHGRPISYRSYIMFVSWWLPWTSRPFFVWTNCCFAAVQLVKQSDVQNIFLYQEQRSELFSDGKMIFPFFLMKDNVHPEIRINISDLCNVKCSDVRTWTHSVRKNNLLKVAATVIQNQNSLIIKKNH